MGKFDFENQGTSTYLVCNLTGESIDTMSLGMLTNNKIPGLAPALYTQQDELMLMKYNISSHITLRQFFSGTVSKKRLLGAFSSIVTAFVSAEEYMLDLNSILLNLDYIFADVTNCTARLICVPVLDMPKRETNYGTFFKKIIFSARFDQTEDCGYVTHIINYLNGAGAFSVEEFGRLLTDLSNMTGQPAKPENSFGKEKPASFITGQAAPSRAKQVTGQWKETSLLKDADVHEEPASFAVPVPSNPPAERVPVENATKEAEKEVSLFYLLQHYNKQNAAQYKAQKAAKKQAEKDEKEKKKQEKLDKKTQKKEKKAKKEKSKKTVRQSGGMAIPGASPNGGMATPGASLNGGMATPKDGSFAGSPAEPVNASKPSGETGVFGHFQTEPNKPIAGNTMTRQSSVSAACQSPSQKSSSLHGGGGANFGQTTVLSSSSTGATTVLTDNMPQAGIPQPYLFRQNSGEKIALNRPVFRIGTEPSFADYLISDNTAVSHSHANFITNGGACYVVDTNSTNHTYVNGAMIQSNVETALKDGDLVRLADEEFQFRMV